MSDGRAYMSDYCPRHPHLDANFTGKKKEITTGALTQEYMKHMQSVLLRPQVVNGKEYQECPKCHLLISEKV